MSAPQQFALGVFYVPPANQAPNAGAAFMSNMTQQRTVEARMMLGKRLAARDPTARNAQLVELQKVRADLLSQLASTERARIGASSDQDVASKGVLNNMTQLAMKRMEVSGGLSEAAMRLEAAQTEARALSPRSSEIAADVQGALRDAADSLSAAAKLPAGPEKKAAADAAFAALVPRLGAASRVAQTLPKSGERDALSAKVLELAQGVGSFNDPGLEERFMLAASSSFQRPGEIGTAQRGYVGTTPGQIAGDTAAIMEQLGMGAGAAPSSASVSASSARSGAAPARGVGSATAPDSADPRLEGQLRAIDALEKMLRDYDPQAALGGLYDPYPGARPARPRVTPELLARTRQRAPGRFERATKQTPLTERLGLLDPGMMFTPPEERPAPAAASTPKPAAPPPPSLPRGSGGAKAAEHLKRLAPPGPGGGAGDVKTNEAGASTAERIMDAYREADESGVTPPAEPSSSAERLGAKLRELSPEEIARSRDLLNKPTISPEQAARFKSSEGVSAFAEKRAAALGGKLGSLVDELLQSEQPVDNDVYRRTFLEEQRREEEKNAGPLR